MITPYPSSSGGGFTSGAYVGSARYSTIQAAIDACAVDGTVIVAPGAYSEAPLINGKTMNIQFMQGVNITAGGRCLRITGSCFVRVSGLHFYSGASDSGLLISDTVAVAVFLTDCHIDTSANNTTDPVSLTGAGVASVRCRGCTFVAEGTRKSFARTDANTFTVDAFGCVANKPSGTGVTANGLMVDPLVTGI